METKYKDRFGVNICSGHTIRPFQDDFYGRPAIIRFRQSHFVVDIPDYEDGIDLDEYVRDAQGSGWELEIVQPYPNAEPYKR